MGQHSQTKEQPEKRKFNIKEMPKSVFVIRLVIASIIFAVAAVVNMPAVIKIVLLAVSALAAGYDIVLDAVNSVEKGGYFETPVIIVFVAVIAFVIGFAIEGAAMIILCQIAAVLKDYVRERTIQSAEDLLRYRDREEIEKTVETADKPGAGETKTGEEIGSAAAFVLKIAIGFAVLFAIVAPLFTNLTYRESIHRALSMILVSAPASVVLAMPLVGLVGIFSTSRFGVLFNKAGSIEKLSDIKTVIVDKAGVLAEESPRLLSVQSDVLDTETFMTFAAHAVYYSEQPIAKTLSNATDGEYKLDVISNFTDIPGYGVEVDIGRAHVTLATKELYISRGEAVPYDAETPDSQAYYMMVSDRYVGKIVLSRSAIDSTEKIVSDLKAKGVGKCILLSEDGSEDIAEFAAKLGFDDAFGELDVEKKLTIIENICEKDSAGDMYLYSNGIESHSKADIDVRVSKAGKYADALVNPNSIALVPSVFDVAKRIKAVSAENAIFAVAIKALLIFLSVNGWCNIWFAMFIDSAAAIFTELNAIRVSSESLLKGLKLRRAEEDEYADE